MPNARKLAAKRIDDAEEQEIAAGDVYMDPESMAYESRHEEVKDDSDEVPLQTTMSLKAMVISEKPDQMIGHLLDGDQLNRVKTRIMCKVFFEENVNWSSKLRFEFKAERRTRQPEGANFTMMTQTEHVWHLTINAASNNRSATPIVHQFDPIIFSNRATSAIEQDYQRYCVQTDQKGAIKNRDAGYLFYAEISFRPAGAQTQGILTSKLIDPAFTRVQEFLFGLISAPTHEYRTIRFFFEATNINVFLDHYRTVTNAFAVENARPPWTMFFGGLSNAKCKVQKGQVTGPADRPPVKFRPAKTYPNHQELWTVEGMSVIYQEEQEIREVREAQRLDCQLRLMRSNPGGDRVYPSLLRLSDDYNHRFSAEDSFLVMIGQEEWHATILPKPFPLGHSVDYFIALKRLRVKIDGVESWSTFAFPREVVFDLSDPRGLDEEILEEFCRYGESFNCKVIPLISDVPYKFRLAAIKTLNPAHEGEKNHKSNDRWGAILLGQDVRAHSTSDIFRGMDWQAKLTEWGLTLDESQMDYLQYLTHVANGLGIIRGAWGTGKTYMDVIIATLLISEGYKVEILSPTNRSADTCARLLQDMLNYLQEEKKIHITDKHVVRCHAPSTEARMLEIDRDKYLPQDHLRNRWQNSPPMAYQSYFDKLVMDIMDGANTKKWGINDRRYQEHYLSFSTLMLQKADLLDRPGPVVNNPQPAAVGTSETSTRDNTNPPPSETTTPQPPESVGTTDTATSENATPQSSDSAEPHPRPENGERKQGQRPLTLVEGDSQNSAAEESEEEDFNDGDSLYSIDWHVAPRATKVTDENLQAELKELEAKTEEALALLSDRTPRDALKTTYREMFLRPGQGEPLDQNDQALLTSFENRWKKMLLEEDVAAMVTTIINSGHKIYKEGFKPDHIIVQEAPKADTGELCIPLAKCKDKTTMHWGGDMFQLPASQQDDETNPFASQTNEAIFPRLVYLYYPTHSLIVQHRTIPEITEVISNVWYRGLVTSNVNTAERPNAGRASNVHQRLFQIKYPIIHLNVDGQEKRVGFSRSKQNEMELQVAMFLCREYIKEGVDAKDILILAGYLAQVGLTKRALANTSDLREVDAGTIDGYQGEQKSVLIICAVGSDRLGFMAYTPRLNTGLTRACDAAVLIINFSNIKASENRRKMQPYIRVKEELESKHACCDFGNSGLEDRLVDLGVSSDEAVANAETYDEHDIGSNHENNSETHHEHGRDRPPSLVGGAPEFVEEEFVAPESTGGAFDGEISAGGGFDGETATAGNDTLGTQDDSGW